MYYEIYIDSLFLLNFTLNLYLLLLVNRSLHRAATRKRLIIGAIAGGVGYCLMFLVPFGGVFLKVFLVGICVNGAILCWVFKPHSIKAFLKTLETMFICALFMGGIFFLLTTRLEVMQKHGMSVVGVLAIGGLAWLLFTYIFAKKKADKNALCRVSIVGKNNKEASVWAVVDTGNSLIEPISGKPVAVLDKSVFDMFLGEEEGFRAIPYRSVGCERGILKGMQVAELRIEQDGIQKVCSGAYIGLSESPVSSNGSYQMLVHPKMLD